MNKAMQLNGIPRFLCDEMLGRLGRYLRAAGYDTTLASGGEPDSRWLKQAIDEGRYFLTRDRLVLEYRIAQGVAFLLPEGDLDRYASALSSAFTLHWTAHAFTRCLVDNTLLITANDAQRARLPACAAHQHQRVMACPTCGRLYWQGSHYRRMRERLLHWQGG